LYAQAMLFAAAHPLSGAWLHPAGLALGLGWLRQRTGHLYAPFVAHASFNAWVVLRSLET
jgi:membrane protease YdiL (CAAX protease family)